MRAVVQLVSRAGVSIGGKLHAQIGRGMLLLVGVADSDDENSAALLAKKLARLRIFPDRDGKLNCALRHPEIRGDLLVVSNFTLYADCSSSRRPDFIKAAKGENARRLFDFFLASLRLEFQSQAEALAGVGVPEIKTGVFGADMSIDLVNEGPVTLILDTDSL